METNKKPSNGLKKLMNNEGSLFSTDKVTYQKGKDSNQTNALSEKTLNKTIKSLMARDSTPIMRVVSPKEYFVLEKLASENKLSPAGIPLPEHWQEYVKMMNEE